MDIAALQDWVGNSQTIDDVIDARQANLMCATLDRPAALVDGAPLPALWHWIYFAEACPASALGADGHAALGDFMPPIDQPPLALTRRMWAGGRVVFHRPLMLGATATKTTTIKSISPKTGRSGRMCFVTLSQEISSDGQVCISDEKDIVYLEPRDRDAPQNQPPPAPDGAQISRTIAPSSSLLFRYSALTFNGHRIHYDLDFCRTVEGYPDLVVHGPLLATLLAGLAEDASGRLATFSYRAVSPIFNGADFSIHGRIAKGGGSAWASNPAGLLAMQADFSCR